MGKKVVGFNMGGFTDGSGFGPVHEEDPPVKSGETALLKCLRARLQRSKEQSRNLPWHDPWIVLVASELEPLLALALRGVECTTCESDNREGESG